MHRFLCTIVGCVLFASLAAAAGGDGVEEGAIFPLAEVQAGQRGFGLSVFAGTEPERFEVEVLGVWRQVQPDTSFILARLAGHGLEESGVIAGMSGSPVYLEGRLAGAVAFSWPFALHPIAVITPIEAMHRLAKGTDAAGATPMAPPVELDQLVAADLPRDLLERRLASLVASPLEQTGTGVIWSAAGFGPQSREMLATNLGSVAPAGRSEADTSLPLVPGASVSGVLVEGDLRLAATGTVTERDGDQILAFGHPFLGTGQIEIPMATAEVITVISNQFNSFKIANLGTVVGAFDLDRMTGVRGHLGRDAPMTPLRLEVRGDRSQEFEVRVARVPMLTPTLVAISVLGALESVTQAGGTQGLDLRARFDLADHGALEIGQSFDGETAGIDAALYLFAFTDYLLNNYLAEVDLRALEVELEQHPRPRVATLVEAHASKTLVRPGDTVALNLDLLAYRGERERTSMVVTIPTGIPDGRYSLLVGDGVSIDVARLTIEQSAPVTFAQALKFLRSLHSRRQLVVLGVFGGRGLAVAGEVLPQLPASVRSLWGAAASSSAVPLQLAIAQQQEMEMSIPVVGAVRVDLEVRREGPLAPEATGDGESDDVAPSPTVLAPTGSQGSAANAGGTDEEGSQ